MGCSGAPALPGTHGEKKWRYALFVLGRKRCPFVNMNGSASDGVSVCALTVGLTPLN